MSESTASGTAAENAAEATTSGAPAGATGVTATGPTATEATAREENPRYRGVEVERVGLRHYRATNAAGDSVDFGQGEGLLTPVELLLAAVAGCSAVDVDVVSSRRAEPEELRVRASGLKVTDEGGGSRLDDVELSFSVRFPEGSAGEKARAMVPRLVELSQTKDCTVSRTVEHPTSVTMSVED
ncbi:OsmC family protein [Rothia santali]|uniref:OsmC family protein n=1 Tax=Rothia santali TaxID=2949643 RepID=UPI0028168176|nr:OsmC family protein [Rothia santali]